jgi:hypothetical protein
MVANNGRHYGSGPRWYRAFTAALLGVFAAGFWGTASAQTTMDKARARRANSPFNLNAGPNAVLQGNLVQCGINNQGDVCTDIFNSPTGGGGFWPSGTTNQYIFNSGLQIAGINSADAGPWARDTVGAYFFDARGTQAHGTSLSDVYNSLNASDFANWPTDAIASDTSLFNAALIGNKVVSDQDSWVRYWDGDPNRISQRSHPMGIRVEQRSLAFNAPAGAEHTIFFIYRFTNITNDPQFQSASEQRFTVTLPDAGWTIGNIYAAFAMDPDVTTHATDNFSTGILPFSMGVAYHGRFATDDFNFAARADLYAPPFFVGPGFVGVKYLKSPVNPATRREVGLTMFSNTTNGQPFPDPVGVKQLFRYLKGDVNTAAGDPTCTIPQSVQRRLCALVQDLADTRFFQASGPFELRAGESATIVVAYTHGPPRRVPEFVANGTNVLRPGIPSFTPGVGADTIRTIEKMAGLIAVPQTAIATDQAGNTFIDESKLVVGRDVARGSLLANALVAQTIFNNRFLLPRPPESPSFSLVPGNNQVTVVWGPSPTDRPTAGDPYAAIAANQNSPLYNANYRRADVEGYRIYRATGLSGGFELVAQFDKTGTSFLDFTGELDPAFVPEEGEPYEGPVAHALNGEITMFPTGARIRDAVTGAIIVTNSTKITLEDTGVPFAFVDRSVRNGITYRYIVTAFDINSLQSGAVSLESPRQSQFTVPRKDPSNITFASFKSSVTGGGQPLDLEAPLPTIDANTGVFSGPMPPANGLATSFQPLAERLMPAFKLTATVDSILPYTEDTHPLGGCPKGSNGLGACWRMFMTFDRDGTKSSSIAEGFTPVWDAFGDPLHSLFAMGAGVIPPDPGAAQQFNLTSAFPGFSGNVDGTFTETILYSQMEGQTNRRAIVENTIYPGFGTGSRHVAGGSRWYSGANETVADPARLIRVGHLDGVDSVWAPIHHTPTVAGDGVSPTAATTAYAGSGQMQCFSYFFSQMGRAADVRLTWGANGAVTALDRTHNTSVLFKPNAQASFGFLNTDANGNGVIDWSDFNYLSNVSPAVTDGNIAGLVCGHQHNAARVVQLENTAKMNPVSVDGSAAATAKTASGRGFGMYINGERYIFQICPGATCTGALPASGQTWTLRTYTGILRAGTAASGSSADPSGYSFRGDVEPRQPMVTGITVTFESPKATALEGEVDMKRIHTVPDPYYVRSQFDLGPTTKALRFVNLPPKAIIRIYTLNGTLVRVLEHNDPQGGAEMAWDLKSRNNQYVASGVYFYHVEADGGKTHTGKFTVIQFAR